MPKNWMKFRIWRSLATETYFYFFCCLTQWRARKLSLSSHPCEKSVMCVFHQRWQWLHFSPESWLFHVLPQPRKWCVLETSSRVRNISFFIFPFLSFLFYLSFFIFPLLLLITLYKYRKSRLDDEICFGFIVFFENYKEKYWFWEIIEMYRKLILISAILLFDSKSHSQIDFAVIIASALVISHTMVRPIKGKFEDRLQALMLWIIFFNVCLGAIYLQPTIFQNLIGNESIFVLPNSAVVLIVVGKFYLLTISNDRFC